MNYKKEEIFCYKGVNAASLIECKTSDFGLTELGDDEIGFLPLTGYQVAVVRWALLCFQEKCYEDEEITNKIKQGIKDVLSELVTKPFNAKSKTVDEIIEAREKRMKACHEFQMQALAIYEAMKDKWN